MTEQIDQALEREYEAGFVSDIESETFAPGLDEDVIRRISAMKSEPEWMLEWRLKAIILHIRAHCTHKYRNSTS